MPLVTAVPSSIRSGPNTRGRGTHLVSISEQLGFFCKERETDFESNQGEGRHSTGSVVFMERAGRVAPFDKTRGEAERNLRRYSLTGFCQGQALQSSGCIGRLCEAGEEQEIRSNQNMEPTPECEVKTADDNERWGYLGIWNGNFEWQHCKTLIFVSCGGDGCSTAWIPMQSTNQGNCCISLHRNFILHQF